MAEHMRDLDVLPERVSLPSFCCIRICDREVATVQTVMTDDALLVYVLCADHASLLELP